MVERMLLEAANIKRLGDQYSQRDVGQLTVATTHTQARYALPAVITEFKRTYPKVHLKLHQASPGEIVKRVPDLVMSALDADVMKTYVGLGLGVGIVASMAVDPKCDSELRQLDSAHLFPENVARIAVRRGHYPRRYAYGFIELCAAELTEARVTQALRNETEAEAF